MKTSQKQINNDISDKKSRRATTKELNGKNGELALLEAAKISRKEGKEK